MVGKENEGWQRKRSADTPLAAPATLGAQRSIINRDVARLRVATIAAGSGSRPQLSKCPVILGRQ
jgi:hypothetical protein